MILNPAIGDSSRSTTVARCVFTLVACVFSFSYGAGQTGPMLAPTPPMGWNSWDAYGTTVREDEVKANADYMAAKLKPFGWQYIVVDIEWYATEPKTHGYIPGGAVAMDRFGRFLPAPGRFPSAAGGRGMAGLAEYVHARGLKLGVHIMRGIPRKAVEQNLPIEGSRWHAADIADKKNVCMWAGMEDTYGVDMSKPGAQDYYDSIARLYAQWGLDYIKADDMSAPYQAAEIHALSTALRKTGRPIVLSLSPGPAPLERHADLAANAQLWRISGDFWDSWPKLRKQFDLAHAWESYVQPGGWPDADMLPIGRIGLRAEVGEPRMTNFTAEEQRTMLTLWSILRSPLMFGGDLPSNNSASLALITNPEVIAVDQASSGGHEAYRHGDTIAWIAKAPQHAGSYVAIFNVAGAPQSIALDPKELGLELDGKARTMRVRDLWARQDMPPNTSHAGQIAVHLPAHGAALLLVKPQ